MKKSLLILAALCSTFATARAADTPENTPLFPFVLPWDDASPGITNMSSLLDKPAGGRGFVIAKNGHFYEGEKRLRFFGVNDAFGANFPTHEDAEKIAARMAKFGINCVRFHHMDNQAAPSGIWSADMKTLDPGQLDKLDYFIAQLKKNGIYTDLNLHVSRNYPGMPKWEHAPGYFKGVDLFYPPMIAMQHDYAHDLLTHVNPYTKTAYINEPAVAIIEINNENGLISEWGGGSLDEMSDVYRAELDSRWNAWLQKKYPTQNALEKAWNVGEEALGAEMLKEQNFEKGADAVWQFMQLGDAKGSASRDDGGLHVNVTQTDGVNWHVQLSQGGFSFSKNGHYTVTFRARADAPRRIAILVSQAHAPWTPLWNANMQLTKDWKDYTFTFQPPEDEKDGRIVFSSLAGQKSDCWIANVSLRPGGVSGLQKGEQLGKFSFFKKAGIGMRTDAARRDWVKFLYDTESDYWTGMQRFLKEDLKARSMIVGSATGFSPASIQAKLDAVDIHAYWQHPHFPHKPWDRADWTVNNIPMAGTRNAGEIPGLMERHVEGKPYICTEYNEASPNTHMSESFLLANAYEALQDCDGIFVFAYSHRLNDWNSQRICSFFDLDQNPVKLATLPAAVAMFLRGDVAPAKKTITIPVSEETAIDATMTRSSWWGMRSFGMETMLPLQSGVRFDFSGRTASAKPVERAHGDDSHEPGKVTVSDTGELLWNADKECVTINAPKNKAFIGKIATDPIKLGGWILEPGKTMQDWAAITMTEMPSAATKQNVILITATGYSQNTGMKWTSAEKNSVGENWGKAPSLVEGIPVKITLPAKFSSANEGGVEAWALDASGQRKGRVPVTHTAGGSVIEIGPKYETLWYEIMQPASR